MLLDTRKLSSKVLPWSSCTGWLPELASTTSANVSKSLNFTASKYVEYIFVGDCISYFGCGAFHSWNSLFSILYLNKDNPRLKRSRTRFCLLFQHIGIISHDSYPTMGFPTSKLGGGASPSNFWKIIFNGVSPPPHFGLFLIHYSHKIFNNIYKSHK